MEINKKENKNEKGKQKNTMSTSFVLDTWTICKIYTQNSNLAETPC